MPPEERLARLEVKVDMILDTLKMLPVTGEVKERLQEQGRLLHEHDTFIDNLRAKIAIAGAGFVFFGSLITFIVQWALKHVNIGWGAGG